MAGVLVDNGESVILQLAVNKISVTENFVLKLFTSNTTPVETSVLGDFTIASGFGYADITLTGASWTVTGSAPTAIGYAQQTFTFTGNLGDVYGYLLVRESTGDLIAAERFSDGPYDIVNNGDNIKITLNITLD